MKQGGCLKKSKNGNKRNKVMNFQNVKGTKNSFSYSIDFNRENIALNDEIIYFFYDIIAVCRNENFHT